MVNRISQLSTTEHAEILKILQAHDVMYSQNENGTFINFTVLNDNVVSEIKKFTDFCIANKRELDSYEQRMSECKIHNDFTPLKGVQNTGATNVVQEGHKDAHEDSHDAMGHMIDDCTSIVCPKGGAKKPMLTPTLAKQDEAMARYFDMLVRARQLDAKSLRKTMTTNKFTAAKKKFYRRNGVGGCRWGGGGTVVENDIIDELEKDP